MFVQRLLKPSCNPGRVIGAQDATGNRDAVGAGPENRPYLLRLHAADGVDRDPGGVRRQAFQAGQATGGGGGGADFAADPFADAGAEEGSDIPPITFSARYISLYDTLKIVTDLAGLKFRIDGRVVMIVPLNAADGDIVILDHTEKWIFKTGESVEHRFATMHELKDGKIIKWSDFWDVSKFVGQFPQSFLEVMAKKQGADFTS